MCRRLWRAYEWFQCLFNHCYWPVFALSGRNRPIQVSCEFWAMPEQSNSLIESLPFVVLSIAVLAMFITAMGKQGAWLLLLIVLAMLIRSRVTK